MSKKRQIFLFSVRLSLLAVPVLHCTIPVMNCTVPILHCTVPVLYLTPFKTFNQSSICTVLYRSVICLYNVIIFDLASSCTVLRFTIYKTFILISS